MALEPARQVRTSRVYRVGTAVVEWWARRYTRRVEFFAAESRRSEVDLELWEFAMAKDQYRWSGLRAALSLILRTLLGAPRDLRWRRAALRAETPPTAPVRLLSARRRPRVWIPLQFGHTFDQTNGRIEPEHAMPYVRSNKTFGAAGNAFGSQGGF